MFIFSVPVWPLFSETLPEQQTETSAPRIGLVLGGGGALGFAHVGVLLAMEEAGVDPDIVVGTSIGSIVGGLYSAGYSPQEMKKLVLESDWQEILFDNYSRDKMVFEQRLLRTAFPVVLPFYKDNIVTDVGISHAQHVLEFLDSLLYAYPVEMDFDTLPRRFRAVSTDLVTGEKIVFDYGDLKTVIRASMAVPGIFTPVHYRNRYLIDGGWVDNVPAITAVEMGADVIITVPLGSLQPTADKLTTLSAVSQQSTELLLTDAYGSDEDISNLVIRPELSGYTMADFDKGAELIEIGYTAGKAVMSRLTEIAALQDDLKKNRNPHPGKGMLKIRKIILADSDPYTKEILTQLNELIPGEISNSRLRDIFADLYDSGRFKRCSYRLLPDSSGGYTLEADIASIQLPDVLVGFGVEYTGYFAGSTLHRGKLETALIKPFGRERVSGLVTFISVSNTGSIRTGYMTTNQNSLLASVFGYLEQEPVYYYDGSTLDSFYSLTRAGGDMLLTLAPSVYFHLTLQPYAEYCYFNRQLGENVLPGEGWSRIGGRTSFTLDTLDDPVNPESGVSLRIENDTALEEGSRLISSVSWNGNGFLPILPGLIITSRGDGGINLADSPKESEYFFLGKNAGFHGYLPGEIAAGAYATAALNIRKQIGRLPLLLGREIFIQITANAAALQPPGMELSSTEPDWYYGGSTGLIANFPVGELSLRFELNGDLRPGIYLGLSSVTAPGFN